MDQNNKTRPTERGKTGVSRERPRTPASRPKNPRPRQGNASQREAARTQRRSPELRQEEPRRSPSLSSQEEAPSRRRDADQRPAGGRQAGTRKPAAPKRSQPRPAPSREEALRRSRKARKKKPHRVYNTNFAFKFGIMLGVVAVIVLSMIIFFKVKHIEVLLPGAEEGKSSYYSAQEIEDASGIHIDDNLLSLSKATAASRIYAALPYVNEVQIKKQLPGTVIISFTEFEVTYGIQDETGGWWLMNNQGRILEQATEQSVHGHLLITGMPINVPEVGDFFRPAATEGADLSEIASKETVVKELLPKLEKQPFAKQIVSVDVSASYDLTLWYETRYEIKLGTTESLEYKLQCLQGVLDHLGKNNSGSIDLTFNEDQTARFLPFK